MPVMTTVGILQEPDFENRVSMLPETVAALTKKGVKVLVANNAGEKAFATNAAYESAGATVLPMQDVLDQASIWLVINKEDVVPKQGKTAIGLYYALANAATMEQWKAAGMQVFSMDKLPRTTRAQSMDVLSSQGNIAGYKAVIKAAERFPRYFPMFMTAAGSIPPAKLLILGAGVAGLQAIATAKRLGAVVEVFDTRPAVKEEVQSLGAKFIEIEGSADASSAGGYAVEQSEEYKQRQQQKIAEAVAKSDIVITTAQIPGKKAPTLISSQMLDQMKPGSVIIDLAASTGGNCELTQNNTTVSHNGIQIIGNSFLPAEMPFDASKVYGKNILNFLSLMLTKEAEINFDVDDDLVKGCKV
jgi:H+-translocating NAD(P) transhydrogenase subunit alpha